MKYMYMSTHNDDGDDTDNINNSYIALYPMQIYELAAQAIVSNATI